ncbi:MAG: hypothetical protein IIY55_11470 [Blautia sp.]|nr:hypothetical protein [Blautia sp.]
MNCMNCGARLGERDQEYCPNCGFHVMVQRKICYLSDYHYNQGLEKATIRDLSGAINCLKQSLAYNKNNIQARNLLGLVYFETGEVVAALSEWVISKNLKPKNNLASDYIARLQANTNKLEAINETIRKYNHALELCREGHGDMAAIQLRRVLAQNSKLIKGYHLLALLMIRNREWNKARKILRKAARIDKTNTTTLRFLKEVDEQTGVQTRLDFGEKKFFHRFFRKDREEDVLETETAVHPVTYKGHSRIVVLLALLIGITGGAAGYSVLMMPAIRQGIYRQANAQIVRYSESLASQGVELTRAQGEAEESGTTAMQTERQYQAAVKTAESYHRLLISYLDYMQSDLDSAALEIQNVYKQALQEDVMGVYNLIVNQTGVTGIEDPNALSLLGEEDTAASGYEEEDSSSDYDDSYDTGYTDDTDYTDYTDYTDDTGYTEESYEDDTGGMDTGYEEYTDDSYEEDTGDSYDEY